MQVTGDVEDVGEVLDAMLLVYVPVGKKVPEKLAKVWLATIADQPFASILHCANRIIRSNREWMPKPGQFLEGVESHARAIKRLKQELEKVKGHQ